MNIINDLHFTLKILKKNFFFTLLCVSVIAFGLAIVLPLYSYQTNTTLKPIPLPNGDQYVSIRKVIAGETSPTYNFSYYDNFEFSFLRDNANSFQLLSAWKDTSSAINDGEFSELFSSAEVSAELLAATQQQALMGRILRTEDSLPNAEPVILIGYDVWQNYFTAREDIIGHQSRIDGEVRTIIGVMPEGYGFPIWQDLWLPLQLPITSSPGEGTEGLIVLGILHDGVPINIARNEINTLHTQLQNNWPQDYAADISSIAVPYVSLRVGDQGATTGNILLILELSIILLVAFNVSNLFVSRGEERIQELSIRSALGATPTRVAQTLLLESLIICIGGIALGLILGIFTTSFMDNMMLNTNPQLADVFWWDMSFNTDYILTIFQVFFIIWILSGGLPAWRISRTDLQSLISNSNKGISSFGSTRLSKVLVNVQLIFGCILMSIGLVMVLAVSAGKPTATFNHSNLFTGTVILTNDINEDPQLQINYRETLRQSLLSLTNIADISYSSALPNNGGSLVSYTLEDQDLMVNDRYPQQFQLAISNNYFALLETNLLQGRPFTIEDAQDSTPVAIIDQRMANTYWPEQSALGKRIKLNPEEETQWLTVVGVTENIFQEAMLAPGDSGIPVIYQPIQQVNPSQFSVLAKSNQENLDYRQAFRAAATQINRDLPINNIQTMQQLTDFQIEQQKFQQHFMLSIVIIAMYLTTAATYGLAVRASNRRRIETGIRMALGASKLSSLAVFLKTGFQNLIIGLSIGGILGVFMGYSVLINLFSNINILGILVPAVLAICSILGVIIILANYLPAKKIIAMEPGDALRYE